jgi:hypothetical protein
MGLLICTSGPVCVDSLNNAPNDPDHQKRIEYISHFSENYATKLPFICECAFTIEKLAKENARSLHNFWRLFHKQVLFTQV